MPARFDVAVLGGGLAGLLMARRLASSCSVVLIDGGVGVRGLGIAACGGADSPARLVHAVGKEAARDLWGFSRRAVARALDLAGELGVPAERRGTARLSLGAGEAQEWEVSAELLRRWFGDEAVKAVDPAPWGRGFDGAVRVVDDGAVSLPALCEALAGRLQGVERLAGMATIEGLEDGVTLAVGDRRLQAEVAVVAAASGAPAVLPWFGPMVYPVRLQGLRTGPVEARLPSAALARHRFEGWQQGSDGSLFFTGCRWAEQPEMGAGESDDSVISEAVSARAAGFLAEHLPAFADAGVQAEWTGIATWSCDGLPLLGPLPGMGRVHSLTGWCGWGLSWVAEGVEQMARELLGEGRAEIPRLLQARRMG